MLAAATRAFYATARAAAPATASVATRAFASAKAAPTLAEELATFKQELSAAKGNSGDRVTPELIASLAAKTPSLQASLERLKHLGGEVDKLFRDDSAFKLPPVRVAVTGAAGQIGYQLLFRIASGAMFGPDQPVILHCIELPGAMDALRGVAMELEDGAFDTLHGIVETADLKEGFDNVDYACLVGARPRGPGMERADLMAANAEIFKATGQAMNTAAKASARVCVVGNPANTNALVLAHNAPNLDPNNISAMTRLDHNRGIAQLAKKAGVQVDAVKRFAIWGNHSSTQYPDVSHTTINGKWAKDVIADDKWLANDFVPTVQTRGAAIIDARGASSAASAANACVEHMRDWVAQDATDWVSVALPSDGSYGVDAGVYYSVPCVGQYGTYNRVADLPIDPKSAKMMEATRKELMEERDMVKNLL